MVHEAAEYAAEKPSSEHRCRDNHIIHFAAGRAGTDFERSRSASFFKPSGVISNAQAKISADIAPTAGMTKIGFGAQTGNANTDTSWPSVISPPERVPW